MGLMMRRGSGLSLKMRGLMCSYTFPQFRGTGLNLWLKVSALPLILKMARKVFRRLTFQKLEIIDEIIETGSAEFCGARFFIVCIANTRPPVATCEPH